MSHSGLKLAAYAVQVDDTLARWLTGTRTRNILIDLASLLDCPYMGNTRLEVKLPTLDDRTERVVYRTWLRLLDAYDSTSVKAWAVERHLIAGLLQNNRWRLMLASECGARRWVALVARYMEHGGAEKMVLSDHDIEMGRRVHADLVEALGAWLGSRDRANDTRALALALFGETWCEMVFDCRPSGETLADMIELTEPSFANGLLADGVETAPQTLPDLV